MRTFLSKQVFFLHRTAIQLRTAPFVHLLFRRESRWNAEVKLPRCACNIPSLKHRFSGRNNKKRGEVAEIVMQSSEEGCFSDMFGYYGYRIMEMFARLCHMWMCIPFLENNLLECCRFLLNSDNFERFKTSAKGDGTIHQFFPIVAFIILKSETNMQIGHLLVVPSRELTYPSLAKGTSSSKSALGGDMLVPRRVPQMFFFQIYHQPNIKWWKQIVIPGAHWHSCSLVK